MVTEKTSALSTLGNPFNLCKRVYSTFPKSLIGMFLSRKNVIKRSNELKAIPKLQNWSIVELVTAHSGECCR